MLTGNHEKEIWYDEDGQVFIQSYSLMQKVVPQIVEAEPRGCSVVNVSVIMSVNNLFSTNNGWPSSHTFKGSPRWRRLTSWYGTRLAILIRLLMP